MKKIIILLSCLIFYQPIFAQLSGSTKPGRLIPKKEQPKKEEIKKEEIQPKKEKEEIIPAPKITILDPSIPKSNEVKHKESSITVRGKVFNARGVKEITVNNNDATLLKDNLFFSNVQLTSGENLIVVRATNQKDVSSEVIFRVLANLDQEGPSIVITDPQVQRGIKIIRKSELVTIKGKATDPNGVLEVIVNNQKAKLTTKGDFSTNLNLQIGDNPIIVKAVDNKFNASVDTFFITRKLEEVISAGRYFALVIGINSYSGYWTPLKNAVNDAEGLANILQTKYNFDEVFMLLDEQATRRNIIHKFEWLADNTTKDDNVLIFYAGHGQFNKGLNKGYWVPVDAQSNSVADYISNNDVKTFVGGIPAKHTLLITDACFAGDIFRGSKTESIKFDPNNMEKYYREVYRKQSRLALTSGGVEEVSDAGYNDHSIFTYYLLKALEENDKKYFDANQLFNEFRIAVTNNSEQTPMLQVIRDTNDEGGQFIFIKKE
ncbi:MAG: caspase family protein [Ignavibacteriaceae bacterium]|nr:caspase family protein [Ignavibacteriaceae bacterium]